MKAALRDELKKELTARGFVGGYAPNGTMGFDDAYLDATDLTELLDQMVARREKVFRSEHVVGVEDARKSYEDTVLVIAAIKSVLLFLTE